MSQPSSPARQPAEESVASSPPRGARRPRRVEVTTATRTPEPFPAVGGSGTIPTGVEYVQVAPPTQGTPREAWGVSTSAAQLAQLPYPDTGTPAPETAHETGAQYPSTSPNPYAEVIRAPVGREAQAAARAARQAAREARERGEPAVVAQPAVVAPAVVVQPAVVVPVVVAQPAVVAQPVVAQPAASSSAGTVVQPAVGAAAGATGPAVASGRGARPAVSSARNVVSSVGHAIAACLPRIISSGRGTRGPSAGGGMPSASRGSRGGSRSGSGVSPPQLPPTSAGGRGAAVSGDTEPISSQQQPAPTASDDGVVQPVAVVQPPSAPVSSGGTPGHLPPSTAAPSTSAGGAQSLPSTVVLPPSVPVVDYYSLVRPIRRDEMEYACLSATYQFVVWQGTVRVDFSRSPFEPPTLGLLAVPKHHVLPLRLPPSLRPPVTQPYPVSSSLPWWDPRVTPGMIRKKHVLITAQQQKWRSKTFDHRRNMWKGTSKKDMLLSLHASYTYLRDRFTAQPQVQDAIATQRSYLTRKGFVLRGDWEEDQSGPESEGDSGTRGTSSGSQSYRILRVGGRSSSVPPGDGAGPSSVGGPSPVVDVSTYVQLLTGDSGGVTAGAGTPTATSGDGAGVLPPVQPVVAVLPPVQVPVEPVAQPVVGQVEALPLPVEAAVPGLPTLSNLSLTAMLAQAGDESGFLLSRGSTGGDPLAVLAESAGGSFTRPPLRGVAGLPRSRPTSIPVQPSVRPRLDPEGWTGSTRRLLVDEQITLHILHSAAERRAQSIIQHGEQAGRAPYWYLNQRLDQFVRDGYRLDPPSSGGQGGSGSGADGSAGRTPERDPEKGKAPE